MKTNWRYQPANSHSHGYLIEAVHLLGALEITANLYCDTLELRRLHDLQYIFAVALHLYSHVPPGKQLIGGF